MKKDYKGRVYQGKLGAGTYYLDEITVPGGYYAPAGMFILQIEENGVSLASAGTTGQPDLNDWITSESVKTDPEDPESSEETIYTVSIRNITGYELPYTGGPGIHIFYIPGMILIAGAGILLAIRRKRLI